MGRNVIGATRYLKKLGWVLLVETDESEAYSPISEFKYRALPWWGYVSLVLYLFHYLFREGLLIPLFFLLRNEESGVRRPKFSC